jgi:hypothetical protein
MNSPVEVVRAYGPDFPGWADDEGNPVVPVYDPGKFYLTRVEGRVYGISNSWVEGQIYVYDYDTVPDSYGLQYPRVVGTKTEGATVEETMEIMKAVIEGFPGFLIRWQL